MLAQPSHKTAQDVIDKATAWNRSHVERRREIVRKNYYKYRHLKAKPSPMEWFEQRYVPVPESGCWLWTGKTNRNGYGEVRKNDRLIPAHRMSWMLYRGDIPASLYALHRCDVRCCVNPEHLFLGTNDDNMKDMASKGRSTHGIKNWCTKLTEDDVRMIRALHGKETIISLANRFGVSHSGISRIQNFKLWKHLKSESEVSHL